MHFTLRNDNPIALFHGEMREDGHNGGQKGGGLHWPATATCLSPREVAGEDKP